MPTFTANTNTDENNFFADLDAYMKKEVLDGEFICEHYGECKKSVLKEGWQFDEGVLPHVGALYDMKRNGEPFRIMVSGAEAPDETLVNMKARRRCITAVPSNPHMKGTLCLLQMLFGEEPRDGELKTEINGISANILEAFALPNRLLCASHEKGDPHGSPTDEILENCEEHYKKAIKILEPQIIVLQGVRAHKFFKDNYGKTLNAEKAITEEINYKGGKPALVLPLYHPAYRNRYWGGANYPAIQSYVKPAVEELLKKYDEMMK